MSDPPSSERDEAAPPAPRESSLDSVLGLIALAAGVLAFLALVRWLPSLEDKVPHPERLQSFLPELRGYVRPEPRERMLYQLGIVVGAVVPIAVFIGLRRLTQTRAALARVFENRWIALARNVVLLAAVVLWLRALAARSELPKPQNGLIAAAGVSIVLLASTRVRIPYWDVARYGLLAVVGTFVYRISLCTDALILIDGTISHHIDVLFGVINHVSHGRTILVDTTSQYGLLYPYVIAALVSPVGVSVKSICAVFSGLGIVSLALVYLVIRRAARDFERTALPELLFLGLIGAITSFCLASVFDIAWIYYQYFPLRIICGCFFFWYVGTFARAEEGQRKRRLLIGGYVGAGVSVLWNADTGFVIVLAWTATAVFDALARAPRPGWRAALRVVVLHGGACAACVFGALGAYGLFALVRSGHFPNFGDFLRFQRNFYGAGFFMLPMKDWEFWQVIVAIPVVGLFVCLRSWLVGTADERSTEKFFIAIYGLGIFSFYQGRSHVYVLLVVAYPAALLGCLFIADLMKRTPSSTGDGRVYDFILRMFAAFAPAVGLVIMASSLPRMTKYFREPPPIDAYRPLLATLETLRLQNHGTEAPVVSEMANYIHLKTQTWSPFPVSSLVEVMTLDQVEQVRASLTKKHISRVVRYGAVPPTTWHLGAPHETLEQWAAHPPAAGAPH